MSHGTYLDGQTSDAHAVDLAVHGDTLRFTGALSGAWPLADLVAMPRFNADDDYVFTNRHYPNARLIVTRELYAAVSAKGRSKPRVMEGFTPAVFAKCLGVLVAFIALTWMFLKVAPPVLARFIPPEMETKLGENVLSSFTRIYPLCEDKAALASMQRLADRITTDNNLARPVTVKIIKFPEANAFALPGGTVVFTSGALRDLKNESQIAGVMAHEQAHVQARHNIQGVLRHLGFSAAAMVVFGHDGAAARIGDFGAGLAMLSHSRALESEADMLAYGYLDKTGYGHAALGKALEAMLLEREIKAKKDKSPARTAGKDAKETEGDDDIASFFEYFQSHPGTSARIAALNGNDTGAARAPRLWSNAELRHLKTACAVTPKTKKTGPR